MYCSYCGMPLPDGARYCPECGRELFAETPASEPPAPKAVAPMMSGPEKQENGRNTVLCLFMALLILPQLFSVLLPMVIFFDARVILFNLRDIVRVLLVSVIGGLSVRSLVRRGWILPGRLRGQDLLMWVLWSLSARMVSSFTLVWVGDALGDEASTGFGMARNAEDIFCNLYGFWSWVLLILLCLARSGRLHLNKKTVTRAGILLVSWSLLFAVLSGPLYTFMTGGPGAFPWQRYARLSIMASCAGLWVRHGFAVGYMALYGSGRLCPVRDVLFALVPALLTALLTPSAVCIPQLGIFGAELSRLAAHMISWALLILLCGSRTAEE